MSWQFPLVDHHNRIVLAGNRRQHIGIRRYQSKRTSKGSGNLQRDTDQLVSAFAQSNPQLRRQEGYSRETIGGRAGVRTTLTNQSDITGQPEVISLATTKLTDGRVLFLVGVAPQRDAGTYNDVFKRVRQSLQLSDR